MPNQMPFGYPSWPTNSFNPNTPNMEIPFGSSLNQNKINELEQRINNLEQRVNSLENPSQTKQNYDYQTSMNMM